MAYHMLIPSKSPADNLLLDRYLGSAVSVDFYWESVGRKLNLPIISSLTEKADSEEGLALSAESLVLFKKEIQAFEKYWIDESSNTSLPDDFLQGIRIISEGVDNAIDNGLTLMVG